MRVYHRTSRPFVTGYSSGRRPIDAGYNNLPRNRWRSHCSNALFFFSFTLWRRFCPSSLYDAGNFLSAFRPGVPLQAPFQHTRPFVSTRTSVVYTIVSWARFPCSPSSIQATFIPTLSPPWQTRLHLLVHLISFFESMFAKSVLLVVVVQATLLLGSVEARIWLLERDGRAIYARRFSQEQPEVLREIAAACGGGVCDTLAGEAVSHDPNTLPEFPRSIRNFSLTFKDLRMIYVLFGFWLLRSLRYWPSNPNVRSRTWPIRSLVCVTSLGA